MKTKDIQIRGWLYVAIAMLVSAKDELLALEEGGFGTLSGPGWCVMGITVLVSGATTLRAYIDQSISKREPVAPKTGE